MRGANTPLFLYPQKTAYIVLKCGHLNNYPYNQRKRNTGRINALYGHTIGQR